MKNLCLILGLVILFSCKTTEKKDINNTKSEIQKGKTIGIVSHQYKATGCKTTIIILQKGQDKPLIIIPINDFDLKFDKDKLKISFDYLPLRIKNPDGCNVGIPAEITNINIE